MRTIQVIGIGAGDPDHLTFQAAAALGRTDVVFAVDKGEVGADLAGLRAMLLARHAAHPHKVVAVADPPRDRTAYAYQAAVAAWQERRAALYAEMIADELGDDGTGSFLVWGDPAIYDGTLRILEIAAARVPFDVVSIPGISSMQALAAAHRIALTRTGRPVTVTTGRRLADIGMPSDDVVVMLDARCAFAGLPDRDVDIYWGAYLGSRDEVLVAGELGAVRDQIRSLRAACRARKGWIMDTYLLRRR